MDKQDKLETGKSVDLLKDASNITKDRYVEVIGATESDNPQVKSSAYYLLSSIMTLDLLRKDRETFLEGFDAVLKTDYEEEPEVRYMGVLILGRLMKPELLENEEGLYMKGIDHLVRAEYDPDPVVAKKAQELIELRKSQLEKTI
jgi:HEAT repeat protein